MTPGSIMLVGHGVVGQRIAQRLPRMVDGADVIDVDSRVANVGLLLASHNVSVAILAHPGPHHELAAKLIERGVAVVSAADDSDDVKAMIELHDLAVTADVPLVLGAGMSPGLTGLLARYLAGQMQSCDEIHIAVHGTAGPSCARQHHRALAGRSIGLQDGSWITRPAGSGRELCWFPEPVGAYDCYRADLPSPLLLHADFPEVTRLSARMSANRRDRLTARLPMMSRPHREGGVGAVRVEVRGCDSNGGRVTMILGVAELVGTSAAATASAFAVAAFRGELPVGVVRSSDERLDTRQILHSVERLGVRLQEFTGVPSVRLVRA